MKTFTGKTEEEALMKAKAELGNEAVVLNIKKINKKGMFNLFNKLRVEITAAVENNQQEKDIKVNTLQATKNSRREKIEQEIQNKYKAETKIENEINAQPIKQLNEINDFNNNAVIKEKDATIKILSDKIRKSDELISTLTKDVLELSEKKESRVSGDFQNIYKQKVFDLLIGQNVLEHISRKLLEEINDDLVTSVNDCKRLVYRKIVEIISEPELININLYSRDREKVVFFLGPTGVGKTTTIAKLASKFILEENIVMGLITSDTYRIAAVEQLKTYAEILGIDVSVIYNKNDMMSAYNNMVNSKDLIFVDTAGRTHKKEENIEELVELMSIVDESDKYLVLSLTTKSDDLIDIVQTYSKYFDFKILFTKADETISLGPILNLCYMTNKKISYITNGQMVPNDVYRLEAESVAKSILGIEVL